MESAIMESAIMESASMESNILQIVSLQKYGESHYICKSMGVL